MASDERDDLGEEPFTEVEARAIAEALMEQVSQIGGPRLREARSVNEGEMALMLHLHLRAPQASPSALAAALSVSSARVANILKSLERKGLVERQRDQADRRRVLVHLTAAGQSFVVARGREALAGAQRLVEALGRTDARCLLHLATRVADIERAGGLPRPGEG